MRRLLLLLVLLGCGKKAPAAPDAAETLACGSTDDCQQGWICLNGECADPSTRAVYTGSTNAVTPGKVKDEVERIGEQREQKNEDIMKKYDEQSDPTPK